ncbi:MAG: hypothetical protein AVDCRST_MAG78-1928, partial [uncultured Rubrobacteraceae bacterium]
AGSHRWRHGPGSGRRRGQRVQLQQWARHRLRRRGRSGGREGARVPRGLRGVPMVGRPAPVGVRVPRGVPKAWRRRDSGRDHTRRGSTWDDLRSAFQTRTRVESRRRCVRCHMERGGQQDGGTTSHTGRASGHASHTPEDTLCPDGGGRGVPERAGPGTRRRRDAPPHPRISHQGAPQGAARSGSTSLEV